MASLSYVVPGHNLDSYYSHMAAIVFSYYVPSLSNWYPQKYPK